MNIQSNDSDQAQSGRFGNSQLLQITSPKPHQLGLEDMDVEISSSAGGNTDLALELPVPASFGQDLAQVPAHEIAVDETPDKRRLKKQVSDLVEALNDEENMVHAKFHEVKLDAGIKVKQIWKDQQDKLKRVATEYE